MKQYIDKAAVVAELERLYNLEYGNISNLSCGKKIMLRNILLFLDTLEVKEVVTEQEGVCNNIFNRIIGDNWNLSIPLDKAGLKHGNKVKIFITKEK